MSRLKSLKTSAARWGWTRALVSLVVRAAARYLGIHVYAVRVSKYPGDYEFSMTNPDLILRKIEKRELAEFCLDNDLDIGADFARDAIDRGDLAYGAFDGDLLVSYLWRSVDCAPDADGVWVKVKKPYNYSYKAFTRAGYRGQSISPVLFLFADSEIQKLGYEYRVGIVGLTNYSSLSLSKHIRSARIGIAGYITWFGKLFTFRSKAVREIGLVFFRPKNIN